MPSGNPFRRAFRARSATARRAAWLPLLALALACGDPGLTPTGATDGTANVSVTFTDAPGDFLAVNVTVTRITLIGGPGQVTLFEGEETFDLLRLRDAAELFAISDDVPAGRYSKVRLTLAVDGLELVVDDGQGGESLHYPRLPGNQKLDLVLRDPLVLAPGDSAALEIDVDVEKSIHAHETRNGEYRFRPVVFVRVVRDLLDGRLARLHGRVANIDLDARSFDLCQLRRPLAWLHRVGMYGPQPGSADALAEAMGGGSSARDAVDFDRWHPQRRCIGVSLTSDASLFDDHGLPIRLGDLSAGDPATVVGRLHPSRDRRLEMFGALVLVGPIGTFESRLGILATDVDADGQVVLALTSGLGDLTLQLFPTTKLFARGGTAVGSDAIAPGVPAAATGVIFFSSVDPAVMNTALLILDLDEGAPEPLHGGILAIVPEPAAGECHLTLDVDGAAQGVGVDDRTRILLIDAAAGQSALVGLGDLAPGDVADVYGTPDTGGGCFAARLIVAFDAAP